MALVNCENRPQSGTNSTFTNSCLFGHFQRGELLLHNFSQVHSRWEHLIELLIGVASFLHVILRLINLGSKHKNRGTRRKLKIENKALPQKQSTLICSLNKLEGGFHPYLAGVAQLYQQNHSKEPLSTLFFGRFFRFGSFHDATKTH
jgi:hypothetical protein